MARRLFIKESSSVDSVPEGFVTISNQGGQIKTSDSTGSKPISSTGEKFTTKGDVYQGELAYLNTDGIIGHSNYFNIFFNFQSLNSSAEISIYSDEKSCLV